MSKKVPRETNEGDRAIARKVASVFGGVCRVTRHADESEESVVDILSCQDVPSISLISYSTIGLSKSPLYKGEKIVDIHLELAGVSYKKTPYFENALSTAAFCIINSKWFCCPGMIFPNVISMYEPSITMKHFMFAPPTVWEGALNTTIPFGDRNVTWLLAIPISDDEYKFAEKEGTDALENKLEGCEADIADLQRASVV